MEQVSMDWVKVWLKGRDESTLLVIGNPMTRILGFADQSSCNAVMFNLSEIRGEPKIKKLYDRIRKLQDENPPGGMIQRWLNAVSSN